MNELLRSRAFASPSSMVASASGYCPRPIWLRQVNALEIISDRPSLISRAAAAACRLVSMARGNSPGQLACAPLHGRLPATLSRNPPALALAMMDLHDPGGGQGGSHAPARLEGPRVEVERGLVGVGGLRPVPGPDEVGEGLLPVAAVLEVVGQLLGVLGQTVGVDLLDRHADRAMELAPTLLEQALIRHVLDERVLEHVCRRGREPQRVDDLEVVQLFQQLREPLRQPGPPLGPPPPEPASDD